MELVFVAIDLITLYMVKLRTLSGSVVSKAARVF